MITDTILRVLTNPLLLLIDGLSIVNITIPQGVFNGLNTLASNLGYIFPITSLLTIFGLKILLRNARNIWALIIRVKSFIPTMGS